MRPLILTLLASGAMLTGCASNPSTVPTATPLKPIPLECRIPCLLPPSPVMAREQWELRVFQWGADCAALHGDCVAGINQD